MGIKITDNRYKFPGVGGASIQGSSHHSRCQDAVLLNFQTGFFAVADGADRYPGTAVTVLMAFDSLFLCWKYNEFSNEEIDECSRNVMEKIRCESTQLLSLLKGRVGSTLTGLKLMASREGPWGVILHTGDSDLYEYLPAAGVIRRITRNNFWMVGRTDHLFQLDRFQFTDQSILLWVTDGITIMNRKFSSDFPHTSRSCCNAAAVEDIPEKLLSIQASVGQINDDAAVMALTPSRIVPSKQKIILGYEDAGVVF